MEKIENMQALNIATVIGSYPVRSLESLRKVELEDGQYMARKIEKGTGLDSKGAIIPALTPEFSIAALDSATVLQGYQAWLQGIAGECAKARIAAGAQLLVDADWNLEAIESYLAEKEVSEGRVSKEKIAAWFDSQVCAVLKSAFKAKLGASISDDKLTAILASYKAAFVLLAKRELALEVQVQKNLEKALELVPTSAMVTYCQGKVKASAAKVEDMLAL